MAAEGDATDEMHVTAPIPPMPALDLQPALVFGDDDIRVLHSAVSAAVEADQAFMAAASGGAPATSPDVASRVVALYSEAARLLAVIGGSKADQRISATCQALSLRLLARADVVLRGGVPTPPPMATPEAHRVACGEAAAEAEARVSDAAYEEADEAAAAILRAEIERQRAEVEAAIASRSYAGAGAGAGAGARGGAAAWVEPEVPQEVAAAERAEYAGPTVEVIVGILEGRDLPIEDFFSRSSDPYCVVRVGSPGGGYKTAKTPTVTKSLSPKWMWQHRFVFPLAAPPTELCISVWDMDIGAQDDPLGSVDLDLSASLRGEAALTDDPDGWTALQHASTGQIRVHLKVERRGTQPDLPWPKHQPWLELLRDHQLPCTDPALKVRVLRQRDVPGGGPKDTLVEARMEHTWQVTRRFSQFYKMHDSMPRLGFRNRLKKVQKDKFVPPTEAETKLKNMEIKGPGDIMTVLTALASGSGPSADELPGGGPRCLPNHPMRGPMANVQRRRVLLQDYLQSLLFVLSDSVPRTPMSRMSCTSARNADYASGILGPMAEWATSYSRSAWQTHAQSPWQPAPQPKPVLEKATVLDPLPDVIDVPLYEGIKAQHALTGPVSTFLGINHPSACTYDDTKEDDDSETDDDMPTVDAPEDGEEASEAAAAEAAAKARKAADERRRRRAERRAEAEARRAAADHAPTVSAPSGPRAPAGVCGPLDVVSSYGPSVRRTLGVRVLSAGKLTQGGQTHTYYTVQMTLRCTWRVWRPTSVVASLSALVPPFPGEASVQVGPWTRLTRRVSSAGGNVVLHPAVRMFLNPMVYMPPRVTPAFPGPERAALPAATASSAVTAIAGVAPPPVPPAATSGTTPAPPAVPADTVPAEGASDAKPETMKRGLFKRLFGSKEKQASSAPPAPLAPTAAPTPSAAPARAEAAAAVASLAPFNPALACVPGDSVAGIRESWHAMAAKLSLLPATHTAWTKWIHDSIAVYFLDTTLEPMYKKVILAMVKEAANSDELKVLTLDEFQLPSRTELPVLRPTSYELEHGYTWHVKWYTSHLECKVSGSGESEVTFSGSFAVSSLGIVGHLQLKPHDGSVADIGETLPEMLDVTFEMLPRIKLGLSLSAFVAHVYLPIATAVKAIIKREMYKQLAKKLVKPNCLQIPSNIVDGTVLAKLRAMVPEDEEDTTGDGEGGDDATARAHAAAED